MPTRKRTAKGKARKAALPTTGCAIISRGEILSLSVTPMGMISMALLHKDVKKKTDPRARFVFIEIRERKPLPKRRKP